MYIQVVPTSQLALGYVRVSTEAQVDHGASLAAQASALELEASRRGWRVEILREEGKSASSIRSRPILSAALGRLKRGEADQLMAVRLDRLSRSVADFASLLDTSTREHWGLVLLSPNIDTSDAAGRFTANVLASAAQYERDLISVRTREGLSQRRAEGIRLGRPSTTPVAVIEHITAMRRAGVSLAGIAATLTAEGVPTSRGGQLWHPSSVRAILRSQAAADASTRSPGGPSGSQGSGERGVPVVNAVDDQKRLGHSPDA